MSTPNNEQKLAIEHSGGVLLKAGAGSGKTFVLKEHLIYLTQNIIDESKAHNLSLDEFSAKLTSFFRKTVLVTFTKKAAGELEIRLVSEFRNKTEEQTDTEYWLRALSCLDYLTVSTIHGFCFKLIKLGLFEGVSADDDILSDSEFQFVIQKILDEWFENKESSPVLELLLKNKKHLYSAMLDIFSDPTVRKAWMDLKGDFKLEDIDSVVQELLETLNINIENEIKPSFASDEFKGKKWFDFLIEFLNASSDFTSSFSGLLRGGDFFEKRNYKMPPKPRGKGVSEEVISFYEKIKNYKDFLKKNFKSFTLYQEEFERVIKPWFKEVHDLVRYINLAYKKERGMTFSDLEYIVYEGLQNPNVQKMVQEQFTYFIVDEFQDTSLIQFEILQKAIGSDFNRLFCVGDLKQAIYGFRGGELGVFLACEKKVNQVLSLKNNYRSLENIISFNNHFFDYLFKKGIGFEGDDEHSVPVEFQHVPIEQDEKGSVYAINVEIDDSFFDEKLSNNDVDYIEALGLITSIEQLQGRGDICVLYKRLKPSLILINQLIDREMGFTAQVKIPFLEDPIVGIFNALFEQKFNTNEQSYDYLELLLNTYLKLLGVEEKKFNHTIYEDFCIKLKFYGIKLAFLSILSRLGIKTSNFKNNIDQITKLITLAQGDDEELLKLLKEQRQVSYSMDFQYGTESHLIKIMTAHASKGLQFKNVLLGGMYTNDNLRGSKGIVGKLPASFKWMRDVEGKEKFKTPSYMLEEELEKRKDFSESKRLFYVANTRAENTLGWVQINFNETKRSKSQKGSWSEGIKSYLDHGTDKIVEDKSVEIKKIFNKNEIVKSFLKPPFFQKDDLGISIINEKSQLYVLPELAVTRLATVVDCPRKFYLQNTCKLTEEELSLLGDAIEVQGNSLAQDSNKIEPPSEELNSTNIKSSAHRGSFIHESLSEIIKENFSSDSMAKITKHKKEINWACEKLKEIEHNAQFISEVPIKFELFGYMISGIPDLIIQHHDKERVKEIWDFKTGRLDEKKQLSYRFQLFCYAYAQYILGEVSKDKEIKLVLCYVDEQQNLEENVSFSDVETLLSNVVENVSHPDIVNLESCEYCPYTSVCVR